MPLPLIPIIGAIAGTIARVAIPAVARVIAPKVLSKPILQAATKVIPKAATPKAVPKTLPAAPKAAPPAPKPVAPSAAAKAKAPAPKPTPAASAAKPAAKPAPKSTAAKPAPKAASTAKKVGTVGSVGAIASIPGSTQQKPPASSSSNSKTSKPITKPPASSTPGPSGGNGNGSGSNVPQYDDSFQESNEEIPDIIFDPDVDPEPPESGVSFGGGDSGTGGDAAPAPVKSAPIDTVLFNDELVSAEIIADLLFENIGGQEILTVARHDTVNGQSVSYQPIKNLSAIQQQYNSESLVKVKGTSRDIFGNFPIDIQSKIPNVGNGPAGSNVYLDENGNIIIEFINLENGQEVEVQITSSGTIEDIGE